jgi:hypothetical protein
MQTLMLMYFSREVRRLSSFSLKKRPVSLSLLFLTAAAAEPGDSEKGIS